MNNPEAISDFLLNASSDGTCVVYHQILETAVVLSAEEAAVLELSDGSRDEAELAVASQLTLEQVRACLAKLDELSLLASATLPPVRGQLEATEVGDQLLVFDPMRSSAFCLSSSAATVYQACERGASYQELEVELKQKFGPEEPEALLGHSLDLLEKDHLLTKASRPQRSRRDFLRAASTVALPAVLSTLIPRPAAASSCIPEPTCVGDVHNRCGTFCTPDCNTNSICSEFAIAVQGVTKRIQTFNRTPQCCDTTLYTYAFDCRDSCVGGNYCCCTNPPNLAGQVRNGNAGDSCLYCGVAQNILCVSNICNTTTFQCS